MKRTWAAALLCVLTLVQLACPPAQAKTVYFLGVEENILPLSDETMPFWHGNYLYISGSIFTGAARGSLKVSYSTASDGSWIALYQDNRVLLFQEGNAYGETADGRLVYPGAVKRNGSWFVPAATVASYFGLKYSSVPVKRGTLVWLRTQDFGLTDKIFADAASSVMEQRYETYMQGRTPQAAEPEPVLPVAPDTDPIPVTGKKIYLCAKAGENTRALLDILDRYQSWMTFFCTPEFLETHDDLLRRMTATGHSVGILAGADHGEQTVLEQLAAGNRALEQATGCKTRLVRIENASAEALEEALAAGFCPEASALERAGYSLENSNQANRLFRGVSTSRQASVLWMGEGVQAGGLAAFLSQTVEQEEFCLPLTETVEMDT